MDGIAYLDNYCKSRGLEMNILFQVGQGTKGPNERNRYILTANYKVRRASQRFAVQYCGDCGVYIAWGLNCRRRAKTSKFSMKADIVQEMLQGTTATAKKYQKCAGRPEEAVWLFRREEMADFFQRCIES